MTTTTNPIDDPAEFSLLSPEARAALLAWIDANLRPARNVMGCDSYGLKHYYEGATGEYVTNGAFKGAMRAAGFETMDRESQNPKYRCVWKGPRPQIVA